MLSNKRQNYHHSKLPKLGDVVIVDKLGMLLQGCRYRKFRVESFPLCDGALYRGHHMSYGIHTCNIVALDNGERLKISGHFLSTIN